MFPRLDQGGTTELPTYSCGGSRRTLDAGPAVSTDALPTPNSPNAGGTDNMVLTLTLPAGAGSDKQGFTATVNLGSSAVQAAGTAR